MKWHKHKQRYNKVKLIETLLEVVWKVMTEDALSKHIISCTIFEYDYYVHYVFWQALCMEMSIFVSSVIGCISCGLARVLLCLWLHDNITDLVETLLSLPAHAHAHLPGHHHLAVNDTHTHTACVLEKKKKVGNFYFGRLFCLNWSWIILVFLFVTTPLLLSRLLKSHKVNLSGIVG